MPKLDPRIDSYIEDAAAFAQPILRRIRELVHLACPEVEETVKWNFPHFTYRGILCSMAAFQGHCTLGFWNGERIFGRRPDDESAMGQFGRLTSIADLPKRPVLIGYVKKAVELNEAGIKNPARARPKTKREVTVPADFRAAIKKNAAAAAAFSAFSPSHRRDYIEWITEAKREETRARRMQTAIKWMAKGKSRNWKYE